MPHIMSDERYNQLMAMERYHNDQAPLPMLPDDDEDDYRSTCGLLEEDDFVTEDEAWNK